MNITKREAAMLSKVFNSEFHGSNDPKDVIGNGTWLDCAVESKSEGGVCTSLQNKGLVGVLIHGRESCIWITQAGYDAWQAFEAAQKAPEPEPEPVQPVQRPLRADDPTKIPDNSDLIELARELYAVGSDNNIEIDPDAAISEANDGNWVAAWVWVPATDDDTEIDDSDPIDWREDR